MQPSLSLSLYLKGGGPGSSSDCVGFLLGEGPGIWGLSSGAHHSLVTRVVSPDESGCILYCTLLDLSWE